MKIKVDVNLELGLLEYELQQAEKSVQDYNRHPDRMDMMVREEPEQDASRACPPKGLH
jgi:hypothetical protein